MNSSLSRNIATGALLLALACSISAANRTDDRDQQPGKAKAAKQSSTSTSVKPATTGSASTPATTQTVTQTPTQTAPVQPQGSTVLAPASPNAGEQIKWQVISGGGVKGTSTSYILSGTVGQTAAGPGTSTSYKVNQGFWQNFSTSCCVGVTGDVNVNGSVNLADLSGLASYLTGGGYVPPCMGEADINASGTINLADLSALVSFLTGGGYVLPSCA